MIYAKGSSVPLKRAIKVVLLFYLAVGLLYALGSGYFTRDFISKADWKTLDDRIISLEKAFMESGYLTICFEAVLANTKEADIYNLKIPSSPELMRKKIDSENGYELSSVWSGFLTVPRAAISESCNVNGGTPVKIASADIGYYEARNKLDVYKRLNVTEEAPAESAVYEITRLDDGEEMDGKGMLYLSDTSLVENSNYVFISIKSLKVKGSALWYLLTPLALVADALTWPIQLYLVWGHLKYH